MKGDLMIKELVMLDMEAENTDDFFQKMADLLQKKGYVKETFCHAICEREAKYPTALPIEPESVAIPHTDPEHILKNFIAPVRLKYPVKWCEMGTSDVEHDVRFAFLLGFHKSDAHIELLQLLVDNFQDRDLMKKLDEAETVDEYMNVLLKMRGFE